MQRANERRLGDSMAGAISPDKGQAPFRSAFPLGGHEWWRLMFGVLLE